MPDKSMDKNNLPFLLLEGVHLSATDLLKESGYENIQAIDHALPEKELKKAIASARFIGIRSRTQLTDNIFDAAKKLVAVGCFCIGTNQVDLSAATRRGIPVFNAPYSNTRSVAELVLAEAIFLLRGITEKNQLSHQGIWQKSVTGAHEIRGKKLGIIGYGNIGSQLSILAESLGMKVVFYDIVNKLPMGNATQLHSLPALLQTADVVSLHVPETPATRSMISVAELNRMKPASILINASRGTVVDIEALTDALHNKKVRGAAIDVFPEEPDSNQDPFHSSLQGFSNVILTPHIGGSTQEAQENIGREVAEKLIMYSDNGTTLSSVNFPEVALPAHPNKHRLLHIHQNVPGVLTAINQVFSENQVNISAQYLQTNNEVGYVVIDVDTNHSEIALKALRKVHGTIRCRILY
ncbi:D-3-phosphoglycerate dehydrogenase [invertebrate metagenome]|uniref:2-oxoglutarate reductase n=1 Tax=invertebrate metagenome TaxID=1711999 RepID=A0A2H9T8C2_9ZZZZ